MIALRADKNSKQPAAFTKRCRRTAGFFRRTLQPGPRTAHELKQLAEACACYEQVVRLRPDQASAWNNLGVARRQLGQCQKAVVSHRRAVTLERAD